MGDCGYNLNDPKHPTFHDRYADAADHAPAQRSATSIAHTS